MQEKQEKEVSEIFSISARRCKRCGGLLTSDKAIRDGYGPVCRYKACKEALEQEMVRDQLSLFGGEEK